MSVAQMDNWCWKIVDKASDLDLSDREALLMFKALREAAMWGKLTRTHYEEEKTYIVAT